MVVWANLMETILINHPASSKITIRENEKKQVVLFLSGNMDKKLEVNLMGQNSWVEIIALVIGQQNSKISFSTIQHHRAANTQSNLLVKSLLFADSSFKYEGLIKIDKMAWFSDAYLRNDNLLFGSDCICESRPYLEISANNVLCTHAVRTGKIEKEQLYYLNSRGISENKAFELIAESVCTSLLEKIKNSVIVEEIKKVIEQKLHAAIS